MSDDPRKMPWHISIGLTVALGIDLPLLFVAREIVATIDGLRMLIAVLAGVNLFTIFYLILSELKKKRDAAR